MILYRYDKSGGQHYVDISEMYSGETAMIVGGSPSLKHQPEITSLLDKRVNNLVTFGINNVSRNFKTDYTIFIDDPACIDPMILLDPTIIKITNDARKVNNIPDYDIPLRSAPGMLFFNRSSADKTSALFNNKTTSTYKNSSLITSIILAVGFGFKNIILAGSDFNLSQDTNDEQYITGKKLNDLELKWNKYLFITQIEFLKSVAPVLESNGITMYDSSFNSNKLLPFIKRIDHKGILDLISDNKPTKFADNLPHCSKFASDKLVEAVMKSGDIIVEDSDIDKYSIDNNKDVYGDILKISH
jgi:hypothetical protein